MPITSLSAGEPVQIRLEDRERPDELPMIRAVNEAAFGRSGEADLVDQLRADGYTLISLVAVHRAAVVGHLLFSRMWVQTSTGHVPAVALAPVAVHPEYQRKGIGSRLITDGLERVRGLDERLVVVVGHPAFYAKFGFSSDKARRLESPFPREAFMVLELSTGALDELQGAVVYPPAFGI